jgi:hypothetical protein
VVQVPWMTPWHSLNTNLKVSFPMNDRYIILTKLKRVMEAGIGTYNRTEEEEIKEAVSSKLCVLMLIGGDTIFPLSYRVSIPGTCIECAFFFAWVCLGTAGFVSKANHSFGTLRRAVRKVLCFTTWSKHHNQRREVSCTKCV